MDDIMGPKADRPEVGSVVGRLALGVDPVVIPKELRLEMRGSVSGIGFGQPLLIRMHLLDLRLELFPELL